MTLIVQPPPLRIRQRKRATDTAVAPSMIGLAGQLHVVERAIGELRLSPHNARKHSQEQIEKIAASIRRFGFIVPMLIDGHGEVIAGDARIAAAGLAGLTSVPTIELSHLSADEARAYRLIDNRLAEMGEWDPDKLKIEIEHLLAIEYNMDLTGFKTPQIDLIVGNGAAPQSKQDAADQVPAVPASAVTRIGDGWILGEHRIFCGDALENTSYEALLGGERAQMMFVDPPYNLAPATIGGKGRIQHRPFPMASGELNETEFADLLVRFFRVMVAHLQDGALAFTCIDSLHLHALLGAGYAVFDELKTVITWAKTNAGMGSLYRSQTELIPLWKKGKAAHINNIELGRHGRYRTTLWTYAGANAFGRNRMADLAAHPTVKPCVMVMDAIKDCSRPKDIILDPFGGSGTTLIAAAKTKRRGYLIELDPLYVDLTISRWQTLFKTEARHAATGLTFAEMAAHRLPENVLAAGGDDA